MAVAGVARNIVFVHPDLGIGGAERLVIDAAVGLQFAGHNVTILTSYCDPLHCFPEARDGTLDVRVRGDAIFPASIGARLSILFAILRQLALVASVGIFSSELKQLDPDVFFVDQLSVCVPFFRLIYPKAKVLFYGHFPDRLLAKEENGFLKYLKALYRVPFDSIESWSTRCADSIVVNSKFTRAVFRNTFSGMRSRDLKVIYPCVDTGNGKSDKPQLWPDKRLLLSINRYEGKKNLGLAIKAYAGLSSSEKQKAKLAISGGYDPRVLENRETHEQLQELANSLNLTHATYRNDDDGVSKDTHDMVFLQSVSNELKHRLLDSAALLMYTPKNEHFGIVPLEAMLAGVPVLATNTGGPLETIYDGRTGWLRSPDKVDAWTDVMRKPLIPSSTDNLKAMGQKGRERVLAEFSHTKMTESLNQEIEKLCSSTAARPKIIPKWAEALAFCTVIALFGGFLALGITNYAMTLDSLKEVPEAASSAISSITTAVTKGRDEL